MSTAGDFNRHRVRRLALVVLAATAAAGAVAPASAQQSYLYRERRFGKVCPPGLKFLAGTCVRHCPAGYRNTGRYCRLRSGGGLGW